MVRCIKLFIQNHVQNYHVGLYQIRHTARTTRFRFIFNTLRSSEPFSPSVQIFLLFFLLLTGSSSGLNPWVFLARLPTTNIIMSDVILAASLVRKRDKIQGFTKLHKFMISSLNRLVAHLIHTFKIVILCQTSLIYFVR